MARGFTVDVARLPRHYGLAHDEKALRRHYAVTTYGELVVRTGGCTGPVAGTFPLPNPATSPNRMTFRGTLPQGKGDADICLTFTASMESPFYAVESMQLLEKK